MWRPLRILAGFCYQPKCPLKKQCFSLSFRAYWQCIKPSYTSWPFTAAQSSALTSFWLSSQCQRIVSLLIWNLLRFAVRHLWRSKGQSNSSNSHENRRNIKSTRNHATTTAEQRKASSPLKREERSPCSVRLVVNWIPSGLQEAVSVVAQPRCLVDLVMIYIYPLVNIQKAIENGHL